jgi:membrane-associated phospholipid phosphatase
VGSPLLSHALATTHDAIIGHWSPKDKVSDSPAAPADLSYLSEGRRVQLLLSAVSGMFQVAPESGGQAAVIKVADKQICRIARPADGVFKQQLDYVRNYADLRLDRMAEILAQDLDILTFFASLLPVAAPRRKATFELLTTVQSLCIGLEMQAKHYCWAARPVEFSQQVQPVISTPDHSTFPSGHATEAFAIATVLHRLTTGSGSAAGLKIWAMPFRLAHRIAVNRTVAGLHFPVDSAAGAILGCAIGDAFCDIQERAKLKARIFGPVAAFDDFTPAWLTTGLKVTDTGTKIAAPELTRFHWRKARAEWGGAVP